MLLKESGHVRGRKVGFDAPRLSTWEATSASKLLKGLRAWRRLQASSVLCILWTGGMYWPPTPAITFSRYFRSSAAFIGASSPPTLVYIEYLLEGDDRRRAPQLSEVADGAVLGPKAD